MSCVEAYAFWDLDASLAPSLFPHFLKGLGL